MLTQRMQSQLIRDLCEGREPPPGVQPGDLDEPWRNCYHTLVNLPLNERRDALLSILSDMRHREAFVAFVLAGRSRRNPPPLSSLADLSATITPITWLWKGWIPCGMLSLLGSVPGAGKSLVALDLARRLIAGRPFPDGSLPPSGISPWEPLPFGPPPAASPPGASDATVVYVDAEGVPQLIGQRASQWGIDGHRLFLLFPEPDHPIDFCQRRSRERLVETVHAARPALVIVDSLSCIHSKGENSVENVRQVLAFLNTLAADARCALLLIHHLRKRSSLAAPDRLLSVDDFRGSSHIVATARSVIGLSVIQTGPRPDRDGPRRLEVVKANLARHPEPLGLELCPHGSGGVRLRYHRQAPTPYQRPTDADECAAWLLEILREHGAPMRPQELVRLALDDGFSRSTVYRARRKLGLQIADTGRRRSPANKWTLTS